MLAHPSFGGCKDCQLHGHDGRAKGLDSKAPKCRFQCLLISEPCLNKGSLSTVGLLLEVSHLCTAGFAVEGNHRLDSAETADRITSAPGKISGAYQYLLSSYSMAEPFAMLSRILRNHRKRPTMLITHFRTGPMWAAMKGC